MEIRKRELLIRKIKENNGIITTKEVINLGIHKDVLKELTIKKELEKITNGLYALPSENIDEYLYFSYKNTQRYFFSRNSGVFTRIINTNAPCLCDDCKGRR